MSSKRKSAHTYSKNHRERGATEDDTAVRTTMFNFVNNNLPAPQTPRDYSVFRRLVTISFTTVHDVAPRIVFKRVFHSRIFQRRLEPRVISFSAYCKFQHNILNTYNRPYTVLYLNYLLQTVRTSLQTREPKQSMAISQ
jgi:hypothetical protein